MYRILWPYGLWSIILYLLPHGISLASLAIEAPSHDSDCLRAMAAPTSLLLPLAQPHLSVTLPPFQSPGPFVCPPASHLDETSSDREVKPVPLIPT